MHVAKAPAAHEAEQRRRRCEEQVRVAGAARRRAGHGCSASNAAIAAATDAAAECVTHVCSVSADAVMLHSDVSVAQKCRVIFVGSKPVQIEVGFGTRLRIGMSQRDQIVTG